ncbi:dihydrodipicolinate synthase family protein [Alicyclobacillus sp. SO9]|uniref:dihydrodipicolinate synthase family protein n=1 Tax=Alicyclobacillus sp. SO9 TaxID=2665646 RepID=UPI001E2AAA93|nr:dihydrodipicolinate synthase family protein [Alicyclobacillus sp. SO9]
MMGVIPAMVTPMHSNNQVNFRALMKYAKWLVQYDIAGLFALGTTGEGLLIPRDDWARTVLVTVQSAEGKCPVIIQCGGASFPDTQWRIETAVESGADAVAIIAPYFYRHSEKALERYFSEIFQRWPEVDFYLYNIPVYSNNVISPELFGTLFHRFANLKGIKDSTGSEKSLESFVRAAPDAVVYTGSEAILQEAYELGAAGSISGIAAALPEIVISAWKDVETEDFARAHQLKEAVNLFDSYSTIASVKAVLAELGFDVGKALPPLRTLDKSARVQLVQALADIGLDIKKLNLNS